MQKFIAFHYVSNIRSLGPQTNLRLIFSEPLKAKQFSVLRWQNDIKYVLRGPRGFRTPNRTLFEYAYCINKKNWITRSKPWFTDTVWNISKNTIEFFAKELCLLTTVSQSVPEPMWYPLYKLAFHKVVNLSPYLLVIAF